MSYPVVTTGQRETPYQQQRHETQLVECDVDKLQDIVTNQTQWGHKLNLCMHFFIEYFEFTTKLLRAFPTNQRLQREAQYLKGIADILLSDDSNPVKAKITQIWKKFIPSIRVVTSRIRSRDPSVIIGPNAPQVRLFEHVALAEIWGHTNEREKDAIWTTLKSLAEKLLIGRLDDDPLLHTMFNLASGVIANNQGNLDNINIAGFLKNQDFREKSQDFLRTINPAEVAPGLLKIFESQGIVSYESIVAAEEQLKAEKKNNDQSSTSSTEATTPVMIHTASSSGPVATQSATQTKDILLKSNVNSSDGITAMFAKLNQQKREMEQKIREKADASSNSEEVTMASMLLHTAAPIPEDQRAMNKVSYENAMKSVFGDTDNKESKPLDFAAMMECPIDQLDAKIAEMTESNPSQEYADSLKRMVLRFRRREQETLQRDKEAKE